MIEKESPVAEKKKEACKCLISPSKNIFSFVFLVGFLWNVSKTRSGWKTARPVIFF